MMLAGWSTEAATTDNRISNCEFENIGGSELVESHPYNIPDI